MTVEAERRTKCVACGEWIQIDLPDRRVGPELYTEGALRRSMTRRPRADPGAAA